MNEWLNATEKEIFDKYHSGLRTAYQYKLKRKYNLKRREERQTSECCRVLCLTLMLIFTIGWMG